MLIAVDSAGRWLVSVGESCRERENESAWYAMWAGRCHPGHAHRLGQDALRPPFDTNKTGVGAVGKCKYRAREKRQWCFKCFESRFCAIFFLLRYSYWQYWSKHICCSLRHFKFFGRQIEMLVLMTKISIIITKWLIFKSSCIKKHQCPPGLSERRGTHVNQHPGSSVQHQHSQFSPPLVAPLWPQPQSQSPHLPAHQQSDGLFQ